MNKDCLSRALLQQNDNALKGLICPLLNNHSINNLELQVINEHNWTERSLLYLCRAFDNLVRGRDYRQVLPGRSCRPSRQ